MDFLDEDFKNSNIEKLNTYIEDNKYLLDLETIDSSNILEMLYDHESIQILNEMSMSDSIAKMESRLEAIVASNPRKIIWCIRAFAALSFLTITYLFGPKPFIAMGKVLGLGKETLVPKSNGNGTSSVVQGFDLNIQDLISTLGVVSLASLCYVIAYNGYNLCYWFGMKLMSIILRNENIDTGSKIKNLEEMLEIINQSIDNFKAKDTLLARSKDLEKLVMLKENIVNAIYDVKRNRSDIENISDNILDKIKRSLF